jgi:hypothetical protein
MEQASGNRDRVESHFGQDCGHFEGVNEVGLPRMPDLSLVFQSGKHIGPTKKLPFFIRSVAADLLENVFESNH